MSGPLHGVRVLEFAGIGPAPFCAMLLADLGADVVRIERAGDAAETDAVTSRGKTSLSLDLKSSGALALALAAIERADVLIEGFRPGVMERLGLGPDVALERNPRLVYGRMTGWGQTGPLAHSAGHDLSSLLAAGLDEPVHLLAVRRRDQGAHLRVGVERISDLQPPRRRRSTSSAISAAARSTSRWGSRRRCSNASAPVAVRSSMRPSSTAPRR